MTLATTGSAEPPRVADLLTEWRTAAGREGLEHRLRRVAEADGCLRRLGELPPRACGEWALEWRVRGATEATCARLLGEYIRLVRLAVAWDIETAAGLFDMPCDVVSCELCDLNAVPLVLRVAIDDRDYHATPRHDPALVGLVTTEENGQDEARILRRVLCEDWDDAQASPEYRRVADALRPSTGVSPNEVPRAVQLWLYLEAQQITDTNVETYIANLHAMLSPTAIPHFEVVKLTFRHYSSDVSMPAIQRILGALVKSRLPLEVKQLRNGTMDRPELENAWKWLVAPVADVRDSPTANLVTLWIGDRLVPYEPELVLGICRALAASPRLRDLDLDWQLVDDQTVRLGLIEELGAALFSASSRLQLRRISMGVRDAVELAALCRGANQPGEGSVSVHGHVSITIPASQLGPLTTLPSGELLGDFLGIVGTRARQFDFGPFPPTLTCAALGRILIDSPRLEELEVNVDVNDLDSGFCETPWLASCRLRRLHVNLLPGPTSGAVVEASPFLHQLLSRVGSTLRSLTITIPQGSPFPSDIVHDAIETCPNLACLILPAICANTCEVLLAAYRAGALEASTISLPAETTVIPFLDEIGDTTSALHRRLRRLQLTWPYGAGPAPREVAEAVARLSCEDMNLIELSVSGCNSYRDICAAVRGRNRTKPSSIVVGPSLRQRLAVLSVLARRPQSQRLPFDVVRAVFELSGRRPTRQVLM